MKPEINIQEVIKQTIKDVAYSRSGGTIENHENGMCTSDMITRYDFPEDILDKRIDELAKILIEDRKKLEDKIKSMEERLEWLDCLEAAGVDNWSGYSYAQDIRNGEEE